MYHDLRMYHRLKLVNWIFIAHYHREPLPVSLWIMIYPVAIQHSDWKEPIQFLDIYLSKTVIFRCFLFIYQRVFGGFHKWGYPRSSSNLMAFSIITNLNHPMFMGVSLINHLNHPIFMGCSILNPLVIIHFHGMFHPKPPSYHPFSWDVPS